MTDKEVEIYISSSCDAATGHGGWAAILRYGVHQRELFGAESATTNNRLILVAAARSLLLMKQPKPIRVFCSSEYLTLGASVRLEAMRNRGFDSVANGDLWRNLDAAIMGHSAAWVHIKADRKNVWLGLAHRLAQGAANKQSGKPPVQIPIPVRNTPEGKTIPMFH